MNKLFLCVLAAVFLSAAGCNAVNHNAYDQIISVNGKQISVELAQTPTQLTKGLSGRPALSDEQGMLFDFRHNPTKRPGFWMKGMKFNLDLIWIKNNKIIGITPNVPMPTENENLPLYYPPQDIDMVLEVNAGWTEKNKIKIGDKIQLQ